MAATITTFADLEARVKSKIEASDLYSNDEIASAINEAVDDVAEIIHEIDPNYPTSKATVVFTDSDLEKDLPADFHILVHVKDENDVNIRTTQVKLQDNTQFIGEFYIYKPASGNWVIGRREATSAITLNIWYVAEATNEESGSTMSLTFYPKLSRRLMIIKAAMSLISDRGRRNRRWERQEIDLSAKLIEQMLNTDSSSPEYVALPGI